MMGRSHLVMGACACGVATATQIIPWHEPKTAAGIYGLVLAGAVFPDSDHKSSSVTLSWGPVTWIYCRIVRIICRIVYRLSRAKDDPKDRDPHRTFTHTWPGAICQGLLTSTLMQWHQLTSMAILAVLFGCAARVFDKNWLPAGAVIGGSVGWSVWPTIGQTWWVFAAAMACGCYLHVLTDCVTKSGAPLRFPFITIKKGKKRNGDERIVFVRRWHMTGTPRWMRFRTGTKTEKFVVLTTVALVLIFSFVTVAR